MFGFCISPEENLDWVVRCKFSSLDHLRARVQRIKPDNHHVSGNWTAAQNLYHLAGAFEGSVTAGLPAGYSKAVRFILRPFRSVVTSYRFPPWIPIPAAIKDKLEPPRNVDFLEQKSRLLNAIDAFEEHDGNWPPHPVLGRLTQSEWTGFHLRHSEHHLSFVELDGISE